MISECEHRHITLNKSNQDYTTAPYYRRKMMTIIGNVPPKENWEG